MSVNYEVWGQPGTWVDGTTAEQNADIKYPAVAKDTYKEQYTSGGIPYNEIDETLAFWGIGKDCIFCNPQYLAPYCIGGDINTIDVYQEPIKETKTSQSAIFSNGDLSSLSVSYSRRWAFYSAAEIEADTQHRIPVGNGYTQSIYAAMNYQKMMLIPYVETVPDTYTTGSYTVYSLHDYIENQGYLTNQRIVGIGYRARYGDGINENRTSENSGTSLLLSFNIEGKDVSYNSKSFYAHENGMSFLAWSDGSGNCRVPMGINTGRISGNATIGTADTGFRARYCPTNDGTSVPWYFYDPDNSLWKINKTTAPGSGSTVYWYAYPYIAVNSTNAEDVKKYVLEQVAYLGLPFVYDQDMASRGQIGDIGVFLPVFDEDGITTGNYEEGINALRLPNSEWVDGREGSGYDPNKQDDDGDEGIKVKPSTPAFTLAGHGTKCYALVESDIDEIFDDIYGRSSSSWSKLIKGLQMFGSDPMGAIISFKWYPFSFSSTTNSAVYLGNTAINPLHQYPVIDSTTNSYKSTTATYKWDVSRNFVNSRKTTCRLYLPFYGFYELPVPLTISKTLSVYMSYNVPDEIATWIISFDDVIYDFVECDPSIDIPLTGSNAAQIALTKRNTALSIATQVGATAAAIAVGATMQAPALGAALGELGAIYSGAGTIGGVIQSLPWLEASSVRALASGGAAAAGIGAGAAASGANILNKISNAKLQIGHLMTNLPYHGAASSTTFLNLPMYPYIQFIQNVKMAGWDEPQYKLKVGYACDVWRIMTDMPENSLLQTTGIADMSNMGMELAEVEELNSILQSGFYR